MHTPPFQQSVCFFHTADLSATDAFYRDVLGLPLTLDQGACRIYQVAPTGFIGFCTHRNPASTDGIIITLVTTDVEARYASLVARGVVFEKPLTFNAKFNITQAFLRDPNGYLVEIQRFEDPAWPVQHTTST